MNGLVLDVHPRPMEVAACWLPAGTRASLHGRLIPAPDLEYARYAVIGWNLVSGGGTIVTYPGWKGIRNGHDRASRPLWEDAAAHLRSAELEGQGPVAVYVAIEEQSPRGCTARPRLTAVRVRREGDV